MTFAKKVRKSNLAPYFLQKVRFPEIAKSQNRNALEEVLNILLITEKSILHWFSKLLEHLFKCTIFPLPFALSESPDSVGFGNIFAVRRRIFLKIPMKLFSKYFPTPFSAMPGARVV